ncbi:unnamed protein product [Rotaria sp. Silwood1]|nr:unnamed protein product [Rotaria sp. Silwood1]
MGDVNNASLRRVSIQNFVSENINEIKLTLVPDDHGRASNQLIQLISKSHGTITFMDNKSNRAEFIRIASEASVENVKELINKEWCLKRPSLAISVTGGAKNYNMKPKLLRAFRRGLLKVASTTGAWIITGGMNAGIMKLVGEIVDMNPSHSRPIHLIGIATWGCVAGRDKLKVRGETVVYTKPITEEKGTTPLEPNHTKFIFVDDESEGKYGGEIKFRSRLEQVISGDFFGARSRAGSGIEFQTLTTPSLHPERSDPVPVVLLVVEGGPNTVRTVYEAVFKNNIPAVIFEGTGRCCDLFAKAVRLYENIKQLEDAEKTSQATQSSRAENIKKQLREALNKELCEIDPVTNVSQASKNKNTSKKLTSKMETKSQEVDSIDCFESVYRCVTQRLKFLNIVSLNAKGPVEPDIDLAILKALLKATSGSGMSKTNDDERKREQFLLALEWNRVDIVKNEIMKNDADWATTNLNDFFEIALIRSQTEFVKLFLDHDFSLTDFFRNNDKLPTLYKNSMSKEHYQKIAESHNPLQTIYKLVLQPLIGDFFNVAVALRSERTPSHIGINLENNRDPYLDQNYASEALKKLTGSLLSEGQLCFYFIILCLIILKIIT